jgi:RNA polymerase sigma-70 factor (ECF subfamily)
VFHRVDLERAERQNRRVGDSQVTCWTVIRSAAEGNAGAREAFAHRYEPVARACLAARWRETPLIGEIDDAVQEVFLECFRADGVLVRADREQGDFRAFLRGVVRNVARRVEERRARLRERQPGSGFDLDGVENDEGGLSSVFDRAFAISLLEQAVLRHREIARERGEACRRRVELLRLRFQDGMPIRDIARRWGHDPARVHKDYAKAREEFREMLLDVLAFHHPRSRAEAERECERLLRLFQ